MLSPRTITHFLRSPLGPLTGAIAGILMSQLKPDFIKVLMPYSQIVPRIIGLCTIPILVTTIVLSMTDFLKKRGDRNLRHMVTPFFWMYLIAGLIGMGIAFLTLPGHTLDVEASDKLREFAINAAEIQRSPADPLEVTVAEGGITSFLKSLFPRNLFQALIAENFTQLLIVSIIFGAVLPLITVSYQHAVIRAMQSTREAFEGLFDVVFLLVPVGIFISMATDFATVGPQTLMGLLPFILSAYLALALVFVAALCIFCFQMKVTPFHALSFLHQPLMVALANDPSGTDGDIFVVPSMMKSLINHCGLDPTAVHILTPVGMILSSAGLMAYFSFACIFMAQYYGHAVAVAPLENLHILLLILGLSMLAASTAMGDGIVSMALVTAPLGLPLSAFLIFFELVDYVIAPLRNMVLVQSNVTAIAWSARALSRKRTPVSPVP